ncbi:unnamed protein product [Rotaria sp. Silwood1]|nr:unnamed protein product [Rotaria sp. Silwood1]CAF1641088.1 unnamed protein product [Rotaria sp. Silwood1]CAF3846331.1 unnamed protein product [Rotaria sp. Silwood1]CAF3926582.1 unnamed protein product [Rotaria sp. Silwood1]CAF3930827.1 unnamed protein product [Rotaria sp. Silwood1]
MISKLEKFPNEILLNIFSYLSWDDMLISLWSLNERINSLVCSIFSMSKNGIIVNKPGLSYRIFSSILLPLICNSLSLSSSIKYIHFGGINSSSCDLINICFFYNTNKQRIFPNLRSLYITECSLSQTLIQTLSMLIQHQLNHLTLILDKDAFNLSEDSQEYLCISNKSNQ